MLYIKNSSTIDSTEFNKLLPMCKVPNLELDIESIEYDINRLKRKSLRGIDKNNFETLKNTTVYLENMLRVAERGLINPVDLKFSYMEADKRIVGNPFSTKRVGFVDVDTFDYFTIKDKSVIKVSHENLMNALAFELAHYDLDYDIEKIDSALKDYGMLGFYEQSIFNDIVKDEDIYYKKLSGYKVSKSPQLNWGNHIFYTYFQDKVEVKSPYYGDVISSSINKAIAIILYNVIPRIVGKIELAGVYEDSYILLADKCVDINSIKKEVGEPVAIRLFSRNFMFSPEIEVVDLE